jgi:RNA polymerase sigma-70 factor (ECF subfamily)
MHVTDGQELRELWNSLRGDALRRGADEHTAEDVVQETWLRALRRPPRDPAGFRGWLHVVARRYLREVRVAERHRIVREGRVARPDVTWSRPLEDDSILQRYVDELPEPYRAVIRLRFIEDRGVDEIARMLQRPPETVRSQLKRGLDRMRARLGDRPRSRFAALLGLGWIRALVSRGSLLRRALPRLSAAFVGIAVVALAWRQWGLSAPPVGESEGQTILAARPLAPRPALTLRKPIERESGASAVPTQAIPPPSDRMILTGTVRTPAGDPVPGALVWAAAAGSIVGTRTVQADASGRYRIEPDLHGLLWASHESWGDSRRCYAAWSQEGEDLDLLLTRSAGRLRIGVRSSDGLPVAGARVLLEVGDDHTSGSLVTQMHTRRGTLELPSPPAEATTDQAGEAALTLPDEERVPLLVLAPGLPAWSGEVRPARLGDRLVIELPPPASLRGRCTDELGRVLWQARIELLQLGGRVRLEAGIGPDGRFELEGLTPGPFVVRASEDPWTEFLSARHEGVLSPGKNAELTLTLTRSATIRGQVRELGPLAGATVTIAPVVPDEAEGPATSEVRTDATGAFALGGCSGEYYLQVTQQGAHSPALVRESVQPGPEPLALVIARPSLAPLALEFDGPREFAPRWVELRTGTPPRSFGLRPDGDTGRFSSADPLPAARYHVIAWSPRLGTWQAGSIRHGPGSPAVHHFFAPEPGVLEVELTLPVSIPPDQVEVLAIVPQFNVFGLYPCKPMGARRELPWAPERNAFAGLFVPGEVQLIIRGPVELTKALASVHSGGVSRLELAPSPGVATALLLRVPRPLQSSELVWIEVVTRAGSQTLDCAAEGLRRTREGLELAPLWLPDRTIELRVTTGPKPTAQRPPRGPMLEGVRELARDELLPGDAMPRIEIEMFEVW